MLQLNDRNVTNLGIRTSQIRGDDLIHNGGWYNGLGEKIGWGDLSGEDLRRIPGALPEDDVFIVLHEGDSFWNFVTRPGPIGSMAAVKPDEKSPGVEYVSENCCLILMRGHCYYVPEYGLDDRTETELGFRDPVRCEVISREEAKRLIGEAASKGHFGTLVSRASFTASLTLRASGLPSSSDQI